MADRTLDCQGMNCPMPIVEIARAVRDMETGQSLEVLATDLAFRPDVEAWTRRTGHQLESFEGDSVFKALIRIA